jgi:DNA-binding CsgD family transcriptional regulator
MSNAIRAAHAAYTLDESDGEWLEQLTDLVGPLLDRGRGVVTFRWRRLTSGVVEPDLMQVWGGHSGDGEMLRELLGNLDETRSYLAYCAPYSYRSLSEIARDHPTLEDLTDDRDMQRIAHDRRVVDFEMLRVDESDGCGWMFSVLKTEIGGISGPRRELWDRVRAHIAAGARLRTKLSRPELDGAAAIFDRTNGTLEVQHDDLEAADRRQRLLELIEARREAKRIADRAPLQAIELWEGLVAGRWSLLDVVDTDGRAFTILRENSLEVRSHVALSQRERQVAFLVGRGCHIKLVAYELGLSPSTVRSQLRSALTKLNLEDVGALCRLVATISGSDDTTSLDELGVLALADAPPRIPKNLTGAEREVAALVFDGLSNLEIAGSRDTSPRTVANQLSSIYRKLGVSSRRELVRLLAKRSSRQQSA